MANKINHTFYITLGDSNYRIRLWDAFASLIKISDDLVYEILTNDVPHTTVVVSDIRNILLDYFNSKLTPWKRNSGITIEFVPLYQAENKSVKVDKIIKVLDDFDDSDIKFRYNRGGVGSEVYFAKNGFLKEFLKDLYNDRK